MNNVQQSKFHSKLKITLPRRYWLNFPIRSCIINFQKKLNKTKTKSKTKICCTPLKLVHDPTLQSLLYIFSGLLYSLHGSISAYHYNAALPENPPKITFSRIINILDAERKPLIAFDCLGGPVIGF